MFETPILFIIFNRPDVTRTCFNRIRELRPAQLFIAADGPRPGNLNDEIKCKETRAIIEGVDWNCEVKTLFRDHNLGCGKGVSSAITWFFEQVEQGIILEDDCLPDLSFFNYCQELLSFYKNEPSVFHIGGVNFQDQKWGNASYYFSAVTHVWGWASWRRAWQQYDFDLKDLDGFIAGKKIRRYFDNTSLADYWLGIFKLMHDHKIDTWDNQWTYTIMNKGGVSVVPNQNLVSNIGFGSNATHTTAINHYANKPAESISLPLTHPTEISINKAADFYFYDKVDDFFTALKNSKTTLFYRVKRRVLLVAEAMLNFFIFSRKIRHPQNRVMLVKTDALGDYVIGRNFMEELVKDDRFRNKEMYLFANKRLKPLIESLDKQLFKEVIYFDPADTRKFVSLYRLYFKLRSYKISTIIYPVYSRSRQIDEILSRIGAKELIGFKGDTSNQSAADKKITDGYYTSLIDVKAVHEPTLLHEFELQHRFFEKLLGKRLDIQQPVIAGVQKAISSRSKTVSVCPGAQEKARAWPAEKFGELILQLHAFDNSLEFNIVTGPGEELLYEQITQHIPMLVQHIKSVAFEQLFALLKASRLVICNDSAPAHLAVALGVPSVCISNGNHYRRFIPYPNTVHHQQEVVFPGNFLELARDKQYSDFFYKGSTLEISSIHVDQVYKSCIKVLNEQ